MPNFFCRPAFTHGEANAMATKTSPKKKPMNKAKPSNKPVVKVRPAAAAVIEKPVSMAVSPLAAKPKETAKEREERERRREALQQMLMGKRQEILKEIEGSLGQSLTEDQQRRLESARDVGDQALMDLDRELGISLMEMRNRRRQAIDEALPGQRGTSGEDRKGRRARLTSRTPSAGRPHPPVAGRCTLLILSTGPNDGRVDGPS
jgi:DnaK suppressor protein